MKLFLSLVALASLALNLNAFSLKPESLKIEFTGYKTKKMTGVSGSFKEVKYKFAKSTKSLSTYLKKAQALITPKSIIMSDGNEAVSQNIITTFFPPLLGKSEIKVVFENITEGENAGLISAKLTMAKKSIIVPLKYTVKDGRFEAGGSFDLLSFKGGAKALKALNDSAPGHEGITWPLVSVKFSAEVAK